MRFLLFIIAVFLTLSSCETVNLDDIADVGEQEGVRPIYAAFEEWNEIKSLPPQPIENLGKIYYKSPYIFVNERFKGIHIIDNTDPNAPVPIAFIQIYGCEDVAVNGNFLYADNYTDLVVIDISDLKNVKEVNRVKDLYSKEAKSFPEGFSGYFECVDEGKGFVVGWEEAVLMNPRCLR
ncbi:MAG: hypothetical protein AAGI23_02165 [Bacteroidota bacterium]